MLLRLLRRRRVGRTARRSNSSLDRLLGPFNSLSISMTQELIHNGRLDREAAANALREFLEKTVRTAGFQLKVTIDAVAANPSGEAEVIADIDGRDKEILLERGGEVLR